MNNKSPAMENFLEKFSQNVFGRSRKDEICVTCGSDKVKMEDFKDDLSRKEYGISRMCQKCQDSVFECDEYDDDVDYKDIF